MPIKIPDSLPAAQTLSNENIFVMQEVRAAKQDIRPLQVALLNLMPTKIETETQFARLLGNSPLQVELTLLQTATYESKNTSREHLLAFYETFEQVKERKFDGLVITGAPVELMEFEDVEYWGSVGLLHDVDFEKFPHEHPHHAREILSAAGYDDAFITDVESHCRVWEGERSMLQKTLLAVDEMTGFIIACALVRPDRSLENLEVKSVMKKFKTPKFAAGVDRNTILNGCTMIDMELGEVINETIEGMRKSAKEIGL